MVGADDEVNSSNKELSILEDSGKKGPITFPPDHVPGIVVPKGGSSCSSCEYLKDAVKGLCGNKYFVKWNGSDKIPAPIDSYCSDWYEAKKEKSDA